MGALASAGIRAAVFVLVNVLTVRSEVYSLGGAAFFLLTGELLFHRGSLLPQRLPSGGGTCNLLPFLDFAAVGVKNSRSRLKVR